MRSRVLQLPPEPQPLHRCLAGIGRDACDRTRCLMPAIGIPIYHDA
jgi:hypothetical protein